MNPTSVYWSPWHRRAQDYEYFLGLQPAVVKIMDGGPPDYAWVRNNLPGALIIARDWALSEQKGDMMADPAGTGARHAWEWSEKADTLGYDPANTLVLGINEPAVWDPGVIPALVAYTVAFLDGCQAHGLRGGALQLSVGWPANNGENTPPDWAPYAGVEAAIRRGKHALVLHEYWATGGPGDGWGWYAGRFVRCPWDVPIVIGECGLDMGVVQDPATLPGNRGWQGNVSAMTYGAQCADYMRRCQADRRFFAGTIFATDYQAGEWQSFDTEPARHEIVAQSVALAPAVWYGGGAAPIEPPEPSTPTPTPPAPGAINHPLPAGSYRITQHFNQALEDYVGGRHNGTDFGAAGGTPVLCMAAGVVAWADYDEDYGNYVRVWHAQLGVHTFYAHLAQYGVTEGASVAAGELLGAVGSTGYSTGPHLHLEIRIAIPSGEYSQTAPLSNGRCDPETWAALLGLDLGA
jgi:hypothetical protein